MVIEIQFPNHQRRVRKMLNWICNFRIHHNISEIGKGLHLVDTGRKKFNFDVRFVKLEIYLSQLHDVELKNTIMGRKFSDCILKISKEALELHRRTPTILYCF